MCAWTTHYHASSTGQETVSFSHLKEINLCNVAKKKKVCFDLCWMMYELYDVEDLQDFIHTRIHRAVWCSETARHLYLGGAHLVEPLVVLTHFCVLHPTPLVNTRTATKFGHSNFLQNAIIHPLFYHSTLFAATMLQIKERINKLIND